MQNGWRKKGQKQGWFGSTNHRTITAGLGQFQGTIFAEISCCNFLQVMGYGCEM